MPVTAPAGGVVVEKNVVSGSAFMPGQVLYRIATIDPGNTVQPVPIGAAPDGLLFKNTDRRWELSVDDVYAAARSCLS